MTQLGDLFVGALPYMAFQFAGQDIGVFKQFSDLAQTFLRFLFELFHVGFQVSDLLSHSPHYAGQPRNTVGNASQGHDHK